MSTFTKHSYQFIYSKYLFVKIFILLHFLLFPLHSSLEPSHSLLLSHIPNTTQNHQQPATIIDQWSIHAHHQPTQPQSMRWTTIINPPIHYHQAPSSSNLSPKTQIQRNLKPAKSTQIHMESHSTQIHMKSQNPLIKKRIKNY